MYLINVELIEQIEAQCGNLTIFLLPRILRQINYREFMPPNIAILMIPDNNRFKF